MKKKNYLILILIVSVIGFSTGFYLKFIKSYSDEKLQIKTTEHVPKQAKLSETIAFLEKFESITNSYKLKSTENKNALKRLKTINLTSILTMIISIIFAIWSFQKLLTPKNN